ncbi:hypothetical protein OUZ56_011308 [Daphnia magna]|uniref:Uncharacterized protein n=1 Tax=Daphnia magna TaxID=35525 RepID=A0ABQ9Z051_9CRUS|nr:hypothetical protein OUZ56_011308 [Daphnia magna]
MENEKSVSEIPSTMELASHVLTVCISSLNKHENVKFKVGNLWILDVMPSTSGDVTSQKTDVLADASECRLAFSPIPVGVGVMVDGVIKTTRKN